jgi:hypothetical protein
MLKHGAAAIIRGDGDVRDANALRPVPVDVAAG